MKLKSFSRVIVFLLMVLIFVPTIYFLVPPQPAHALFGIGDITFDPSTFGENVLIDAQAVLTQADAFASQAALYSQYIYTYVLQPLTFILAQNVTKSLTVSVITNVISGQRNGTGQPQFVTNQQANLQNVGSNQMIAFIGQNGLGGQFNALSNSPFKQGIGSSLYTNYQANTSSGGFLGANQDTLVTVTGGTQGEAAFLAGNTTNGGTAAWFSLTTQNQNNPYALYQASNNQLASVVTNAQTARQNQINQGQGFLAWCGPQTANTAPGDTCTNKNGTPGTIQTPATTINASLSKVLGAQQDTLTRMGDIGGQIMQLLGSVGTILKTVNLASNILGGTNGGGLLYANQTGGALTGFAPTQNPAGTYTSGYGNVTATQISQTAASSNVSTASNANTMTQIQLYQSAWSTIGAAANTASTTVTALINTCTTNANAAQLQLTTNSIATAGLQNFINTATAEASTAQAVLANVVAPVVTNANTAYLVSSQALNLNNQVQNDQASGSASYTSDLQALQNILPSGTAIANAQQSAQTTNGATANPTGSLNNISGGTTLDQMNLIATNAAALQNSVCAAPAGVNINTGGGIQQLP